VLAKSFMFERIAFEADAVMCGFAISALISPRMALGNASFLRMLDFRTKLKQRSVQSVHSFYSGEYENSTRR
jgi:hypothetical protein